MMPAIQGLTIRGDAYGSPWRREFSLRCWRRTLLSALASSESFPPSASGAPWSVSYSSSWFRRRRGADGLAKPDLWEKTVAENSGKSLSARGGFGFKLAHFDVGLGIAAIGLDLGKLRCSFASRVLPTATALDVLALAPCFNVIGPAPRVLGPRH